MLPIKYLVLPICLAAIAGTLLGFGIVFRSEIYFRAGFAVLIGAAASLALTIAYLAAK